MKKQETLDNLREKRNEIFPLRAEQEKCLDSYQLADISLQDILLMLSKSGKSLCSNLESKLHVHHYNVGDGNSFVIDLTLPIQDQSEETLSKLYELIK